MDLSPHRFFDFANFEHAALFEGCSFAWGVFDKLKAYLSASALGNIEGEISENAYLVRSELITIGKNTVVEPGAYIEGPCIIGENCVIRHGAYIRGNVITGNGCVIGHATEVKGSVFLDQAKAAHFAYLGDTVLGNRVNLGAGVKCANLRFDGKEVKLHHEKGVIKTERRKFGAIIGDDAQVGCNSVTLPGTLMGKKSLAYPAIAFGGVVEEGQIVKEGSCH